MVVTVIGQELKSFPVMESAVLSLKLLQSFDTVEGNRGVPSCWRAIIAHALWGGKAVINRNEMIILSSESADQSGTK